MREWQILQILPREIREILKKQGLDFKQLQEIRLRVGHELILVYKGEEMVIDFVVSGVHLKETLDYVSNYSLYAYENELRQGFITVEGGHRVGVAGQVLIEKGNVKNLKQISSLNIRVSHEILDCANQLFVREG